MEAQQIEDHRLLDALDALKDIVPGSNARSRLTLYFYLCSFSLIQQAINKKEFQALPLSMAEVSQWAVEFFSEYPDEVDFDKTYVDFLHWIKLKQRLCLENMS